MRYRGSFRIDSERAAIRFTRLIHKNIKMNNSELKKYSVGSLLISLLGVGMPSMAQPAYQAKAVQVELAEKEGAIFAEGFSAFTLPDHFVWCGSAIRSRENGRYYLFYSALNSGPEYAGFGDAWVLGSKIGVAVSDSPYGGYQQIGFVYNQDGYEPDRSSWDAQTTSNTHIRYFDGKYYLYYCGSVEPNEDEYVKGDVNRRNLIQQNHKIGVLCFNTILIQMTSL